MFWYYDPTYLLLIPGLLLALYAQFKVTSTFNHWKQAPSRTGLTGARSARMILDANGCGDVRIEHVRGSLSDHYDPENRNICNADEKFYNDEETSKLLKTEKMFHFCDEMDYIILALMAKDMSYEEIADSLFCSVNTVKYRVKKIKETCNCKSKAQLVDLIKIL